MSNPVILLILKKEGVVCKMGGRIFAFFGDISYSLYIWHWIVFSCFFQIDFYPIIGSEYFHVEFVRFFAIFVSIIISYGSYKYIESYCIKFGKSTAVVN